MKRALDVEREGTVTLPKQWTIEARGVIDHPEVLKAFEDALRAAAVLVGHALGIAHEDPNSCPEIVVFTDDFYTGHTDIPLDDWGVRGECEGQPTGPKLIGKRVEIPVHYDNWMRGARTGKVISYRAGKPGSVAYVNVKLDNPQIKHLQRVWELDWPDMKVLP